MAMYTGLQFFRGHSVEQTLIETMLLGQAR